eukprot:GHVU01139017.1.p1 GENE.GHVU01139017.1~~GHVU01139017.1.p1  ORF type:complete len:262 (-),score=26.81 GHVU01139017.1:23-808(-)
MVGGREGGGKQTAAGEPFDQLGTDPGAELESAFDDAEQEVHCEDHVDEEVDEVEAQPLDRVHHPRQEVEERSPGHHGDNHVEDDVEEPHHREEREGDTCAHAHTRTHTHTCNHIHAYKGTRTNAHTHTITHKRTHRQAHTPTTTHKHTSIHTHQVHRYMQTCSGRGMDTSTDRRMNNKPQLLVGSHRLASKQTPCFLTPERARSRESTANAFLSHASQGMTTLHPSLPTQSQPFTDSPAHSLMHPLTHSLFDRLASLSLSH